MAKSSIEWTELTWNPTTGCNKLSAGCKFCYAETMTKRLKGMGQEKYKDGFKLRIHPSTLLAPHTWSKPARVFVNSMSDLFHKDVPLSFIQEVFKVMNETPQHTYQILTKRGDILLKHAQHLEFTPNIWVGVSVEDALVADRIEFLRQVPAHVRFLSLEPLLGPLDNLNLNDIHWVIVGGESGQKARPMESQWVISIKNQCRNQKVAFFFKQWGTWGPDGVKRSKKANGRLLQGKEWNGQPVSVQ